MVILTVVRASIGMRTASIALTLAFGPALALFTQTLDLTIFGLALALAIFALTLNF